MEILERVHAQITTLQNREAQNSMPSTKFVIYVRVFPVQ